MKKIILSMLSVLSVLSIGSAYATVYIGSESLYENGQYVGRADHYADVYNRNGHYVTACRDRSDNPESSQTENNEASEPSTTLDMN